MSFDPALSAFNAHFTGNLWRTSQMFHVASDKIFVNDWAEMGLLK